MGSFISHLPGIKSYRLLIAGIIVLLSLYIGIGITPNPNIPKINIRNISANVSRVIQNGVDINIDGKITKLDGLEIKSWTQEYIRDYSGLKDIRIDSTKITNYVNGLAMDIQSEPINARFKIIDNKAVIFEPSSLGRKLDIQPSVDVIIKALRNGQRAVTLTSTIVEPELTLEKVNNLGINTLLGHGESNFYGSTSARIHNIKTGADKFNGVLIKPGEIFSFNTLLGEISATNGYLPELVIKNKKIVSEYGGGLCQVSTTLFRSAIYAGLPIVERKPHSFPVRYYNPQGFDATIYPGITDLKFTNNTPNYILIQNKISGTKIIFEIYGTSDSRLISIDGPYQYDQKSNGAMRAYFIRTISYANQKDKQERFDSIYRSPPTPKEKNPLE